MRIWRPDVVLLHCFDKKDKLINKSIFAIAEEEKGVKSNEIILIVLITIFILLFFARTLGSFLILLFSELIIGAFALIKDYKERRNKR